MKRKLYFSIVIVFTFFTHVIQAQYFVKTKIDSVPITVDSTILTVGNYRGELVWQVSSDSTHWTDLAFAGDSLYLRIDSTAVYRGSFREKNCDTIYSDTIIVGEEKNYPGSSYFWAYASGGVHYLPGGMKVKIPPGAIKDSLYMLVEPIDSISSYAEFPGLIDNGRIYLGGIHVLPYDAVFDKPIKIQLPVREFNPDNKLNLSGFDPHLNLHMDYNSYFLASANQKFVEFNTDRLIPVRAEAIVYQTRQGEPERKSSTEDDKDCRKGLMIVISEQSDYASHFSPKKDSGSEPGSCQTITSSNRITFVDCDNVTEYDRMKEISSTCNPEMTVSLEQKYLKVGNQAKVRVTMKIGDLPLGQQLVNISSSTSLKTISSGFTDDDGVLNFTVSGLLEDDEAFIRCSSDANYYLQEVEISSADGMLTENNWNVEKNCNAEGNLKVYRSKIDRWKGTLFHTHEDFCGRYSLNIQYEFTLYWDSLAYQKEKYNSTGGIYGIANVSQSSTTFIDPCRGESEGSLWWVKGDYEPSKTVEISDPFWSNSKDGTLHFETGYLGWWEEYYFDEDARVWVKDSWETYYDLVPSKGKRIPFTNHNHIETDIQYEFGYGYSNNNYVEGFSDSNLPSHLILDRIYSNYEDIGQ